MEPTNIIAAITHSVPSVTILKATKGLDINPEWLIAATNAARADLLLKWSLHTNAGDMELPTTHDRTFFLFPMSSSLSKCGVVLFPKASLSHQNSVSPLAVSPPQQKPQLQRPSSQHRITASTSQLLLDGRRPSESPSSIQGLPSTRTSSTVLIPSQTERSSGLSTTSSQSKTLQKSRQHHGHLLLTASTIAGSKKKSKSFCVLQSDTKSLSKCGSTSSLPSQSLQILNSKKQPPPPSTKQ